RLVVEYDVAAVNLEQGIHDPLNHLVLVFRVADRLLIHDERNLRMDGFLTCQQFGHHTVCQELFYILHHLLPVHIGDEHVFQGIVFNQTPDVCGTFHSFEPAHFVVAVHHVHHHLVHHSTEDGCIQRLVAEVRQFQVRCPVMADDCTVVRRRFVAPF